MKILAIGDVFSKIGKKMLQKHLPFLQKKFNIDLTIVNVENRTNGKGISWKHYKELKQLNIDVMTTGNHVFSQSETLEFIKKENSLIRPINSNPYHPGNGSIILVKKEKKIKIINLLGNKLISPSAEINPFFALEQELNKEKCDLFLVDFHAQTTAEKKCLALDFDGKICALWGTHTHVQTSDEQLLPKGTAFITDIGMTGPSDGVIGSTLESSIKRNKFGQSCPLEPLRKGRGELNGIFLDVDEITNLVKSIERIKIEDKEI